MIPTSKSSSKSLELPLNENSSPWTLIPSGISALDPYIPRIRPNVHCISINENHLLLFSFALPMGPIFYPSLDRSDLYSSDNGKVLS